MMPGTGLLARSPIPCGSPRHAGEARACGGVLIAAAVLLQGACSDDGLFRNFAEIVGARVGGQRVADVPSTTIPPVLERADHADARRAAAEGLPRDHRGPPRNSGRRPGATPRRCSIGSRQIGPFDVFPPARRRSLLAGMAADGRRRPASAPPPTTKNPAAIARPLRQPGATGRRRRAASRSALDHIRGTLRHVPDDPRRSRRAHPPLVGHGRVGHGAAAARSRPDQGAGRGASCPI